MENLNKNKISVYIKANKNDEIIEISSSVFIENFDGWTKIDEGFGDRFAHAQSHYLENPLISFENEEQRYNYKFVDGHIVKVK